MNILVLSDSHDRSDKLESILLEHTEAEAVVFLGDGARGMEDAIFSYGDEIFKHCPYENITQVRGNCDRLSTNPVSAVREYGGVKFYITHGYEEDVKLGLWSLIDAAKKNGCTVALFGHTHMQYCEEKDGILLLNPGAVRDGRYCVIQVEGGRVVGVVKYGA